MRAVRRKGECLILRIKDGEYDKVLEIISQKRRSSLYYVRVQGTEALSCRNTVYSSDGEPFGH